ncbi:hypothetical protein NESM_000806900 [Novymonas esmeraldas]|uniref:Uncharacterized protein n=1 Tax=Novymonas esmeraldas TaxID=1808958 RepID=A0AAW0EY73_9TRYP
MHATRATLQRIAPLKRSYYALDLEFVKFNGGEYVRSAALVPFESARHSPCTLTSFCGTPTILELSPAETMRIAEPLPCGERLAPRVTQAFVHGEALQELLAPLEAETAAALTSYSEIRRALRMRRRAAASAARGAQHTAEHAAAAEEAQDVAGTVGSVEDTDMEDFLDADESPGSLTSAETRAGVAEERALSALARRLHIIRAFKGISPYCIPNVKRFDREALELLHAAPADSQDFAAATRHISCLQVYDRRRGGSRLLPLLARHHPALLQAVLRRSFTSPGDWYGWLAECAAYVEAGLVEARDAHRGGGCSAVPSCASSVHVATNAEPVHFAECDTMSAMADHLNRLWCSLRCAADTGADAPQRSGFKVYAYGSRDEGALSRTLTLSFTRASSSLALSSLSPPPTGGTGGVSRFSPSRRPQMCAAASATATATDTTPSSSPAEPAALPPFPAAAPVQSSPLPTLPSDVHLVDVTQHPLFATAGFVSPPKRMPSLLAALEKAARRDAAAAALLSSPHWHDPLWDAKALACVCTTSGIVRPA